MPDYVVALVDRSPSLGRTRVYLDGPGGDRIACWPSQVSGVPFCDYCGEEGHTKSRATGKNCRVVREEIAEKKARKKNAE